MYLSVTSTKYCIQRSLTYNYKKKDQIQTAKKKLRSLRNHENHLRVMSPGGSDDFSQNSYFYYNLSIYIFHGLVIFGVCVCVGVGGFLQKFAMKSLLLFSTN